MVKSMEECRERGVTKSANKRSYKQGNYRITRAKEFCPPPTYVFGDSFSNLSDESARTVDRKTSPQRDKARRIYSRRKGKDANVRGERKKRLPRELKVSTQQGFACV